MFIAERDQDHDVIKKEQALSVLSHSLIGEKGIAWHLDVSSVESRLQSATTN